MVDEYKVRQLAEEITVGKSGQGSALFHVLFNPPCVLHMNMRISLKILSVLMHIGLESALAGDMDNVLFPEHEKSKPTPKKR